MSTDPDPRARAARRRAQIHAVRLRVAAIGVAAFLALWGVLFVQLATGHDPGLNDASPVAVTQSVDPEASDTSAGTTSDTGAPASGDAGAVTTRQS